MRNTIIMLALVGLAALAGCNDPLHVTIPDIVQPGQLGDSAALATVRAGALGDFSIAYTGDHPDGSTPFLDYCRIRPLVDRALPGGSRPGRARLGSAQ